MGGCLVEYRGAVEDLGEANDAAVFVADDRLGPGRHVREDGLFEFGDEGRGQGVGALEIAAVAKVANFFAGQHIRGSGIGRRCPRRVRRRGRGRRSGAAGRL